MLRSAAIYVLHFYRVVNIRAFVLTLTRSFVPCRFKVLSISIFCSLHFASALYLKTCPISLKGATQPSSDIFQNLASSRSLSIVYLRDHIFCLSAVKYARQLYLMIYPPCLEPF
ncbi:unnamed protein product [Debaryomyces fabryi]|nr:unnamed protein product [Debaryomyces fabryi]